MQAGLSLLSALAVICTLCSRGHCVVGRHSTASSQTVSLAGQRTEGSQGGRTTEHQPSPAREPPPTSPVSRRGLTSTISRLRLRPRESPPTSGARPSALPAEWQTFPSDAPSSPTLTQNSFRDLQLPTNSLAVCDIPTAPPAPAPLSPPVSIPTPHPLDFLFQRPTVGRSGTGGPPRRYKRTQGEEGSRGPIPGLGFARHTLRWQLLQEGQSLRLSTWAQRRVLRLAFRHWSEASPVSFMEDQDSPGSEVDIRVGFGTGRHLGCPWPFDGPGEELAHTLQPGEIHLDDDEPFSTPPSEQGPSLLQVAVHEIGHVLGLAHLPYPDSVMHPLYLTTGGTVELSWQDRRAVQELYGQCEGPFDVVFDWVRREGSQQGAPVLWFNTFFLRGGQYWLYENRKGRPRYGDPRALSTAWGGLAGGAINAVVQVWTLDSDTMFFFKGTQYWCYDSMADGAFTQDPEGQSYPRLISEGFPGISGPLDTAVFLRHLGCIYFFKGQEVLAFSVSSQQIVQGFPKRLEEVFPASVEQDHPTGYLDAAYYSHFHRALFLFKGLHYWEVARGGDPEYSVSHNALLPRRRVAEQWFDLCDVHPSQLDDT